MKNRCDLYISPETLDEPLNYFLFILVFLHDGVHYLDGVMNGAGLGNDYTIEEIVCRNVPMLLPIASMFAQWIWNIIWKQLYLTGDVPKTGTGGNANMAAMGGGWLAVAVERINHIIWTDFVAVVFLYLLIKTVLSSKHLLLLPFKLWQLFYGKPQEHQTKHKDKTVSMTDPDNNWCRVAANFSDKRRYLLEP
ncbi:MAG: hypothetical protein LBH00_08635 [Planctomycetaceae bacterium]|jgi:hypothetical protein|nr:hypothetical protein [Planctomycetaceae bacterium]